MRKFNVVAGKVSASGNLYFPVPEMIVNNFVDPKTIITLERDEAENLLKLKNIEFRIVRADGDVKIATRDYKPQRINLVLYRGFVEDAYFG